MPWRSQLGAPGPKRAAMELFPVVNLIQMPDNAAFPAEELRAEPEKKLLVIYDGDLPFVVRVLAAAGYDDPKAQLHLIRRQPEDAEQLDLATLAERLDIDKVILFGQQPSDLGLHFIVQPYYPIEVAGRTYMICQAIREIAAAKSAGNNQPAAALWAGMKQGFLRPSE